MTDQPTKPSASSPLRVAASILVLRPSGLSRTGFEVLMHRRANAMRFAGGNMAFPGGGVEPADDDPACTGLIGTDPQDILNKVPCNIRVAAVRELFEESGLLLGARDPANLPDTTDFLACAEATGLHIDPVEMPVLGRWIPPEFVPVRYDTWFFAARAPQEQTASHDGTEAVQSVWVDPVAALSNIDRGEWTALFPTIALLADLSMFKGLDALFAALAERKVDPILQDRMEQDGEQWMCNTSDAPYLPYQKERVAVIKALLKGETPPRPLALPEDLRARLDLPVR